MKLNSKLMLKLLKEEYDKRINYYLDEIETKASHSKSDSELAQQAQGLKLRDAAGNLFSIASVEQEEDGVYVYMFPPGVGDESITSGRSIGNIKDELEARKGELDIEDDYIHDSMHENEKENVVKEKPKKASRKKEMNGDIIKPNPKAAGKKSFKVDINAKRANYEEVNGLIKLPIEQLKDFTL